MLVKLERKSHVGPDVLSFPLALTFPPQHKRKVSAKGRKRQGKREKTGCTQRMKGLCQMSLTFPLPFLILWSANGLFLLFRQATSTFSFLPPCDSLRLTKGKLEEEPVSQGIKGWQKWTWPARSCILVSLSWSHSSKYQKDQAGLRGWTGSPSGPWIFLLFLTIGHTGICYCGRWERR